MAGRFLRWSSYACLIGCGLLAASACLDPKSDDLPGQADSENAANPGDAPPGSLGGQSETPDVLNPIGEDPRTPPSSAPTGNTSGPPAGAGGGSPVPDDAGSADTLAADAGSDLDPGPDVPNVVP